MFLRAISKFIQRSTMIAAAFAAVYVGSLILKIETVTGSADAHFVNCAGQSKSFCVVDGDTIRFEGEKIRIADIDTPEVFSPKCASEAELGREATRRMQALLNDGPVSLVRIGSRDQDRYGRKLRIVQRDGQSLGDILVAEGLARRWDGARRSWCG
jgi:endonuclease YncB( thermonuclease family)